MVQESVVEMAAPVIPKRGISNIPKTIVGISSMVEAIVAIWKFPFELNKLKINELQTKED